MAHFARIDDAGNVVEVIVVSNAELVDETGAESESLGVSFCQSLFGGTWVQTSYNGNIRKNYAGVGFTYDATRDAFIPPKPYPSWVLDESTCRWEATVPYPNDGGRYVWDEVNLSWVASPAP